MAEKLAPEKRHSFVHNGSFLSSSNWVSELFWSPVKSLNDLILFCFSGQKVFEWDQTLEEVNMYISLPPNVHPKQFYCKIQSKHIEVGIKGNPPYLNVSHINKILFLLFILNIFLICNCLCWFFTSTICFNVGSISLGL